MTDANVAKEPEEDRRPRAASREDDEDLEDDTCHLDGVPDGSGCTEIWEHLSERRESDEED